MHIFAHIAIGLALVPGSLIFLVVVLWRAARAATGFVKPPLPLRSTTGEVLCTAEDWARHAKAESPVQYALFEALPQALLRLARAIARPFHFKSAKEDILFGAFRVFAAWAEANSDFVYGSVWELEDEGPTQQELAHKAEIRSLYDWWTKDRPVACIALEDLDLDEREHHLVLLDDDDQVHLARLANLWRTLT